MKCSEIVSKNRDKLAVAMVERYRLVLESLGKIQYYIYMWDDGELHFLESVSGSNNWLENDDLFYVCEIKAPFFDPWDYAEKKPDDESEREEQEKDIIDWLVYEYKDSVNELIDSIVCEFEQIERIEDLLTDLT